MAKGSGSKWSNRSTPALSAASPSRAPAGGPARGAGFADLETGIFRELGKIGPKTPMATTIHSRQQAGIRERGTGTTRHRPIAFAEAEILPCWSTGNG
jgi:5-formyltetrahydrofolate cyclo-ligase